MTATSDPLVYTLPLTAHAYGGESLGRLPDGRAVFVPFALSGETVNMRLVEEKKGHARAELIEVLQPSPDRTAPFCPHYGECGGCHYQHMSYPAQVAAKQVILQEQLLRIGKMTGPSVSPTIPCPNPRNYRNHIEFHLAANGRLGFYRHRSNVVLPINECHLPELPLNEIWPLLDFEAIPGLERIGLRMGAGEEFQLILESQDPNPPQVSVEELPVSIVHLSPLGQVLIAGSPTVYIEVCQRPLRVSAGSFFQVNTSMTNRMVEYVRENLASYGMLNSRSTAIDAYCGAGLFSLFIAPQVGRLIGIESSPSACQDFVFNLDEFDHVELYEDSVEPVLAQLDCQVDFILLDPPRAGIAPLAMDGLLKLSPPVLVYISCDPATLARDARRLIAGGYRLDHITPFDLFPQTYHIESISFWVKEA